MTRPGSGSNGEPLDLLVVGGGPAGTAAAFRGTELGLRVLVLDHDDLMRRIRDYSKDKLILPSFGGGDRMAFPVGGECLSELCFEPIDKDEMCARWKGLYRRFEVATRLGLELTALERESDDLWKVVTWDHQQHRDTVFAARHVAIAIGRGVPRRFDIPGNTEGFALRLSDPAAYVGRPACVIGGGTSAAEAVIAISEAKAAADDPTRVYWTYRGEKMPRVSKALAEVFFEAFVGNGNIRYCARSEPAAVVVGNDHREYLAIRIDRRTMDGRPSETTHLEFPKEDCVACIGEDLPEKLLASFGIHMAVGGPRNRKRMVVNRYLESELPGVYLLGDILSPAYFEAEDFSADPSGLREVKHRGNIKAALCDGVLVAQVVRQRLDGRTEISVEVERAETPTPSSPELAQLSGTWESGELTAEPELEEARRSVEEGAFLVRVHGSGIESEEFALKPQAATTIGRSGCDLTFPDDTLLAPQHASVAHSEEGYFLRDDGAPSGVFLQVPASRKIELTAGDLLSAGRQFLRLVEGNGGPALVQYDRRGQEVARHALPERTVVLGRDAPDIVLDASDLGLSRRHLAITVQGGRVLAKDLKSFNGTYLRIVSSRPLEHGDKFRVGQQLLAFSCERDAVLDTEPPPPAAVASGEIPAPAAAEGGPAVTFRRQGVTLPLAPGQTVCDAAEQHGVGIVAECHSGICGSDPVRILSGSEHLASEPSDQEEETLEDICGLKAGECRLACMLRANGPIEVEIIES